MKRLSLILVVALLSACAPKKDAATPTYSIQTSFDPYIARFKAVAQGLNQNYDSAPLYVEIDNTMTGPSGGSWILGVCETGGGNIPTIRINPHFWNDNHYSDSEREELLFHEMGHCILYRGHDNTTDSSVDSGVATPVTIMNAYHLGHTLYEGNYDYYMKELFGFHPTVSLLSSGESEWTSESYYASYQSTTPNPTTGNGDGTVSVSSVKTFTAKAILGPQSADGAATIAGILCGDEE